MRQHRVFRGCPWDCSFCSAWTFYGRSYRTADPAVVAEEMAQIKEPNVFIVDDVAFIHPEHGMAIADELEKRGVKKRYYLETRCDVLIKNQEVFARWAKMGLSYMFLGLESLDADQLKQFRKRITPNQNFEALEVARKLGIQVAINLISDPGWGKEQFEQAREWATKVPEIVHLTVATPYPGTELFHTETRELTSTDYRLYDIQHAVLPTKLPLHEFYAELVKTQQIINQKFMGWRTAVAVSKILAAQLAHGQTNFLKMLFKFSSVYTPTSSRPTTPPVSTTPAGRGVPRQGEGERPVDPPEGEPRPSGRHAGCPRRDDEGPRVGHGRDAGRAGGGRAVVRRRSTCQAGPRHRRMDGTSRAV